MRSIRWLVGFVLGFVPSLSAQSPDTTRLHDLIVTATRTAEPRARVGSSAEVLRREELERHQLSSLRQALELLPGATVVSTGAPGGVTSYFVRGAASTQTLFLLDGVRLNDANATYSAFVGGEGLAGLGRIEVVRGPQSTLYGGAAIGGVVAIDAPVGSGPWKGAAQAEGGSFSSWRGSVSAQGVSGTLRLSGGLSANGTENQRHPNDWHQRTQSVRADWRIHNRIRAGGTFRGLQQDYTSPGDIRSTNTTPEAETDYHFSQGTLWVEGDPAPRWGTRLLFGSQWHRLESTSRYEGSDPFRTDSRNRRNSLDWQNTLRMSDRVRIVAGANREWSSLKSSDDTLDERLWAFYAEATIRPIEPLSLSAGVRSDQYSTFGHATTWRATAAWSIAEGTRVHTAFGTGFMPPGLVSRFGSAFQNPNPGIRPERARGFDLGIEQVILRERVRLGLTWFTQRYRDLIVYQGADFPELGQEVNIDRARASGLELGATLDLGPLDGRLAYTFLSARNLSEEDPARTRLIRRPRHTGSADLGIRITARFAIGAGALAVANREDSDFTVYPEGRVNPGDYVVARTYGSFSITPSVGFNLRVENLFNTSYEPVYGFPALGRNGVAALSVRF